MREPCPDCNPKTLVEVLRRMAELDRQVEIRGRRVEVVWNRQVELVGQHVEMVGKQVWRYPLRFEIGFTLISSVRNLAARGPPSHPQILNILRQLATQTVSGLSLVTKNKPKADFVVY